MISIVSGWLAGHGEELLGVLAGLAYLFFAVRQNIWLWLMGILSAFFFILVFFRAGIYANMALQGYYLGMSVYGWIHWHRGRKSDCGDSKQDIPVAHLGRRHAVILCLISAALSVPVYFFLVRITDSVIPVIDTITATLSITATWMLARKILEHWILWVGIDSVSVGMYMSRSLYATSVLYLIYTIMAIVGYVEWRRTMTNQF